MSPASEAFSNPEKYQTASATIIAGFGPLREAQCALPYK